MGGCCRTSSWAAEDHPIERRSGLSCEMAKTAVQARPVRGCRQRYVALQSADTSTRIDLVRCLSSGKEPFFTEAPESWHPMNALFPSQFGPSTMRSPPTRWGAPISAAFTDLQTLSSQINLAVQAGSRYDAATFCSVLATLQSRLLFLRRGTRSLGL